MKIAIIHNQIRRRGGMETYLFNLAKGFSTQGSAVHLFAYKVESSLKSSSCLNDHRIHRTPLNYLPRRLRKYAFILCKNQTFQKEEFDLSISLTRTACQDMAICGLTQPGLMKRIHRHAWNRLFHDQIEIYFERKMLETSKYVVAHSKQVAQELQQHFIFNPKKLKILYPPIDTHRYHPVTTQQIDRTRNQYGMNPSKMHYLFPSSGHRCKGLNELIQAFSYLGPHFKLHIVGQNPKRYTLPENAQYLGYIEDLTPLYAAVNYTILPSHYEAFGLVTIESIACGTPVIVTQNVGATEILSPQESLIMPDNQPQTIVETLKNAPTHKTISPNFIKKHHLTIQDHITQLCQIASI